MRRLALLLPLVLVLPACSDDGGSGGGDGLEDRRAAYVEQVEQVCTEANEELEALAQPTGVAEVPEYTDTVVALLEGTVQEVVAVEPPEEDREQLSAEVLDPLTADLARAEEYAGEVRAAAEAGDAAALLTLVREVPNTTADLAFMRDYGLVECAEAADTSS